VDRSAKVLQITDGESKIHQTQAWRMETMFFTGSSSELNVTNAVGKSFTSPLF